MQGMRFVLFQYYNVCYVIFRVYQSASISNRSTLYFPSLNSHPPHLLHVSKFTHLCLCDTQIAATEAPHCNNRRVILTLQKTPQLLQLSMKLGSQEANLIPRFSLRVSVKGYQEI